MLPPPVGARSCDFKGGPDGSANGTIDIIACEGKNELLIYLREGARNRVYTHETETRMHTLYGGQVTIQTHKKPKQDE